MRLPPKNLPLKASNADSEAEIPANLTKTLTALSGAEFIPTAVRSTILQSRTRPNLPHSSMISSFSSKSTSPALTTFRSSNTVDFLVLKNQSK